MGQTMTEGLITRWYVGDGDAVNEGDDVYELEYDKSTYTVQAKKPGVIKLLFEEGATVPLGDAVAVILEGGEAFDESFVKGAHSVANAARGAEANDEPAAQAEGLTEEEAGAGSVLATPFVRSRARKMGIDIRALARPGGRVTIEDIESYGKAGAAAEAAVGAVAEVGVAAEAGAAAGAVQHECDECSKCEPVRISPLARKLAKERNIDISAIKPKDGIRVTADDVKAFEEKNRAPAAPAAPAASVAPGVKGRREPMRGMRKSIADNMSKSYFTYPTVTLTTDADMSSLQELRDRLNEELAQSGIKLTVTDMLVKAVAKALVDHEIVNTSLDGGEIVYHEQVNVGVAVALEKGLIVPVVKNANKLSLPEIASETKRLVDLAKTGKLSLSDMSGGTFTITNLGTMGIDAFNPIINPPESAILGVGRTVKKPVVVDDGIFIQPRAVLSFTHDHRVIDGAPGAYFLQSVVRYIENPELLLSD